MVFNFHLGADIFTAADFSQTDVSQIELVGRHQIALSGGRIKKGSITDQRNGPADQIISGLDLRQNLDLLGIADLFNVSAFDRIQKHR